MTHEVMKALGIDRALISKETRLKDFLPIDRYDEEQFQKRINKAENILGIKIHKYDKIYLLIKEYDANTTKISNNKNYIKK